MESDIFICPSRTDEMPEIEAYFDENGLCSNCGSLRPEVFLQRLRDQDIELGPSDSNFYVHVINNGGDPFPEQEAIFYFFHLNEEQRDEFVRIWNFVEVSIGYPGHFYYLPFFVKPKSEGVNRSLH